MVSRRVDAQQKANFTAYQQACRALHWLLGLLNFRSTVNLATALT
jgi:hypothetical protein